MHLVTQSSAHPRASQQSAGEGFFAASHWHFGVLVPVPMRKLLQFWKFCGSGSIEKIWNEKWRILAELQYTGLQSSVEHKWSVGWRCGRDGSNGECAQNSYENQGDRHDHRHDQGFLYDFLVSIKSV